MRRRNASNVTLICVAGVQTGRALLAILKSCLKLKFKKVVFVTPKLFAVKIGRLSIEKPVNSNLDSLVEYNKYVLYKLFNHVVSSHCLLIQADGYVINGSIWTDDFLKYDYIGAPWPVENKRYVDPFGNHQRVGNGGFSLRSKKLLQVPLKIDIPWEVNVGEFYKHFGQRAYSEDGNICVHNRHLFENEGCIFAPLGVALSFSRELAIPERADEPTLGFHRYKNGNKSQRKPNYLRKLTNRLIPKSFQRKN